LANTLALANQKGGVGKTTTAVNVSSYLASLGYRILIVDLDPQGNATSSLGADKRSLRSSTYDVLVHGVEITEALVHGIRPGLDLLGANNALAGAEVELVQMTNREHRLLRALQPVQSHYDVILIDCPPSLGLLTINAFTASDRVIVPIQCEYLALEGLMQLINTMDLVKRRLNPALDVLGVVMTMFDSRTRLSTQVVENVRRFFPNRMFRTIVPRSVRLAEAPSHGQTILEYDPRSAGARAYRSLGDEVVSRLQVPDPTVVEEFPQGETAPRLTG
jgi:chromosome partitioning protein